jgi:hypothetical protein
MEEEMQFDTSQIDISSEKESGTKKRKTEVTTYDFQTPANLSPQKIKFLFKTSIHSSNINKQSGLAGKAGIHTSGKMRRSTISTGVSIPRSTRSSRRKKATQSPDKSPSGENYAWQYAALRPGTSYLLILQFTSDGDGSLSCSCPRRGLRSLKSEA